MILGRGTAQTDEDIVAEYQQFLRGSCQAKSPLVLQGIHDAPRIIRRQIGKPIAEWTDEHIVHLAKRFSQPTWYKYNGFIAFLIYRGYYHPTLRLLANLPVRFSRRHWIALMPYRRWFEKARDELGYSSSAREIGRQINLLVWLLAIIGKPLDELTRADFDAFEEEYNAWYRSRRSTRGNPNPDLYRLERYLVHLGAIPEAKHVTQYEERLASLRPGVIRDAVLVFVQWCDAKYSDATRYKHQHNLLGFFLWLQERHPGCSRLNEVTRSVALEYARYLKTKVEDRTFSPRHRNVVYSSIRLFFDFVIDECLDTAPKRNPFAKGDMPRSPDPVGRYLSDRELRVVFEYCDNGATLKERTTVIVLLHTGIRASELAALQVGDILQLQGKWKVHIREGKGLKDRLIPLTDQCLAALQAWQEQGWERVHDHLFTHRGRPWKSGKPVSGILRDVSSKIGVRLTAHRFRHTFAVALLNYGIRESALQKLLGHTSIDTTLAYAQILDRSVERAFNEAVERMQTGPLSWVPSFFAPEDYSLFAEGNTLNWIRLPHGYCRRHHKLHCESDVKCLLCNRFCALPSDLPRLQEMHDRFLELGMEVKANVVASHIRRLQTQAFDLEEIAGYVKYHLRVAGHQNPIFSDGFISGVHVRTKGVAREINDDETDLEHVILNIEGQIA